MEERKILVSVGLPMSALEWIENNRERQPRSDYLRDIICAEITKRQETQNNGAEYGAVTK